MINRQAWYRWMAAAVLGLVLGISGCVDAQRQWYKGNLHTHSWWSDGDSPPETVLQWYKEQGYHFVAMTDHNTLDDGDKWIVPEGAKLEAAKTYEDTFGTDRIEKRERDGKQEYRVRRLAEMMARFEEPGRFLILPGEEISTKFEKLPVHLNGINLRSAVEPQQGNSVFEIMQNNVNAVLAQRKKTGQPMFPMINHPNFGWGIVAEDLMRVRELKFFELHNAHPGVRGDGDELHPPVERMWDIILTRRLDDLKLPIMYGVATDDAHCYTKWDSGKANPGRAWVVVRAEDLNPTDIIVAMEEGDFYASSGVALKRIGFDGSALEVVIDAQPGVTYKTQFIGTRKGYDRAVTHVGNDPKAPVTGKYSDEIGRVLAEQTGDRAVYGLAGDEIYVRADIVSDKPHPNPSAEGEVEMAWVQPVQPGWWW